MNIPATKTDITNLHISVFTVAFMTVTTIFMVAKDLKEEIRAKERLEQIQKRAYDKNTPETQELLDYVIFGESQI